MNKTHHPRCRIAGEAMNHNERTSTNPDGVGATSTDQEWKDFQAWQEELRRRPDGVMEVQRG